MRRKGAFKYGKSEKASHAEKETLLPEKSEDNNNSGSKIKLSVPASTSGSPKSSVPAKKRIERKRSLWAPVATATIFEDVPVFTICPYCSSKVVTKTQLKKGRKHWCYCCCCLPYFLDVFKDVIHVCPKCNTQIAIYNRFHFFKSRETTSQEPKIKESELSPETTNQQEESFLLANQPNQTSPGLNSPNQRSENVQLLNRQTESHHRSLSASPIRRQQSPRRLSLKTTSSSTINNTLQITPKTTATATSLSPKVRRSSSVRNSQFLSSHCQNNRR